MLRTLQNLTDDANALKAQGKIGAALEIYKDAVRQFPTSGVALHNLAAAYGDAGNFTDADRVAAMAQKAGLNGPETWLVRARARFALNDFSGAEIAYGQAIARQPDNAAARMELAQLVWVRTGDQAATLRVVETPPGSGAAEEAYFGFLRAQVLEHMEETQAALDLMLPLVVKPGFVSQLRAPMLAFASQLAAETGDAPGAVALAEQAVRLAEPGDPGALEPKFGAHCRRRRREGLYRGGEAAADEPAEPALHRAAGDRLAAGGRSALRAGL